MEGGITPRRNFASSLRVPSGSRPYISESSRTISFATDSSKCVPSYLVLKSSSDMLALTSIIFGGGIPYSSRVFFMHNFYIVRCLYRLDLEHLRLQQSLLCNKSVRRRIHKFCEYKAKEE